MMMEQPTQADQHRSETANWDARNEFFRAWFRRKDRLQTYSYLGQFDEWIDELQAMLMDFNFLYRDDDEIEALFDEAHKLDAQASYFQSMNNQTLQLKARHLRWLLRNHLRRVEGDLQRRMWNEGLLLPKKEVINFEDRDAILKRFNSQI